MDDIDRAEFRKVLGVPADIPAGEAIDKWIQEEPTDVTWRTICKGLKESKRSGIARSLITSYLKLPSVYKRYEVMDDFERMDDLCCKT